MTAPKIVLLVIWILCAAGFVIAPDSTPATWARYAFSLMLAAHVLEFLLFFPRIKQAPGSLLSHFFNTILFGLVHVRDLPPAGGADSA